MTKPPSLPDEPARGGVEGVWGNSTALTLASESPVPGIPALGVMLLFQRGHQHQDKHHTERAGQTLLSQPKSPWSTNDHIVGIVVQSEHENHKQLGAAGETQRQPQVPCSAHAVVCQ